MPFIRFAYDVASMEKYSGFAKKEQGYLRITYLNKLGKLFA